MAQHDYEAIGRAVVLIASLFAGSEYVEAPTKAAPKPPKTTSGTVSSDAVPSGTSAANEAPKAEEPKGFDVEALLAAAPDTLTGDNLREAAGAGLTPEQFGKLGMKFAKRLGDNGAKAKEIWKGYKTATDGPVTRFGETKPEEFAKMLGEMADALDEASLA